MNSPKRLIEEEETGLLASYLKRKKIPKKQFDARRPFHNLWQDIHDQFHDNLEEFALDEWKLEQSSRIHRSAVMSLQDFLERGMLNTLYARRILRKGKI